MSEHPQSHLGIDLALSHEGPGGFQVPLETSLDGLPVRPAWPSWSRLLVPAGVGCAVLALSWATCLRNEVWRSSVTLWEDTVAKSPIKSRPWGNLGTAYAKAGDQSKAIACYQRSLSIDSSNQVDTLNLANSFLASNQPEKALELTDRLCEMTPGVEYLSVAVTRAGALTQLERYSESVPIYRRILAANPQQPAANMGLGFIFHRTGHPTRALRYYQRVRDQFPDHAGLAMAILDAQRLAEVASR
jgi:tetratricopeptide (TPR) repeat protein